VVKQEPPMEFTNSIGMRFVLVKPGTFLMGSPADEEGRFDNEHQHEVTITKAFYLGVHPVTVGQWRRFAATGDVTEAGRGGGAYGWTGSVWEKGANYNWQSPGFPQDDSHPVTCVSCDDAVAFCEWLTRGEPDRPYRLPSEAEWEFACRGGADPSPLPFHFAQPCTALSSAQANFDGGHPYGGAAKGPYRQGTTPVGSFESNRLGLYDVHGNVWEWCHDWYAADYYSASPAADPPGPPSGSVRVHRGGGWFHHGKFCRAATRFRAGSGSRRSNLGFRVAVSLNVGQGP
jgi:formylglycine-generating enzyme required for sulfatase activity